jgi:hypothetical protein
MEMRGQLHVPAALLLREEPPIPTEEEDGWTPEPVWVLWELCLCLLHAGFWPSLFLGPEDEGDIFLLWTTEHYIPQLREEQVPR